jgi:hypothetical protein
MLKVFPTASLHGLVKHSRRDGGGHAGGKEEEGFQIVEKHSIDVTVSEVTSSSIKISWIRPQLLAGPLLLQVNAESQQIIYQ